METIESNNIKFEIEKLKHIHFNKNEDEYTAILVDLEGFEILKGYGNSITEAFNDLHHNLI